KGKVAGASARRRELDPHALDAVDERRLEHVGRPRDLDVGQAVQQLVEHHLDLAAGEVRAQAEVRAARPEADVVVRRARGVEAVGIGPERLVAVRRVVPEDDLVAAAMRSSRLLAYSGSPTPRMMFVSSKMRRWSDSGMPIMSQMMRRGSAAATSSTKSHAPLGATASTIRRACARTASSTCLMVRGVNPALTSFRSFVCRGASMLIIEPKNSFSSGVWSGMLTPCPETKASASMLARTTSA